MTDRSESPGCEFCGASLEGMRSHARFCGASCRREHYRISALLSGRADSGYPTLAAYLRKRANRRGEA